MIEVRTLTDGGQKAAEIVSELEAFLAGAQQTLELALYSVRLPGEEGDRVRAALTGAAERGVAVRLAYNVDDPPEGTAIPPPLTEPGLIESLPLPTKAIPGSPDLMHHKYVVRDGGAVWTGSANWSLDSWQREENVIVRVESEQIARDYLSDFEDLWRRGRVEDSGDRAVNPRSVGDATVRAWFSPGRGPDLSKRIAAAIARAQRVRIASPLITAAPILRALGARTAAGDDVTGVVDATQIHHVLWQWSRNPHASWKGPLLEQGLRDGAFHGKQSTPWSPTTVHDFMHAKITVCDATVFVGSFNLSRSGEMNAENVLEIEDAALADRMATWIDGVRERYPAIAP